MKFILQCVLAAIVASVAAYIDKALSITNLRSIDFFIAAACILFCVKGLVWILAGVRLQPTVDRIDSDAKWAFHCPAFSLKLDLGARTLKFEASDVEILKEHGQASSKFKSGGYASFDSLDPLGFTFHHASPATEATFLGNSGTGVVDGKIVQVSLPGGEVRDVPTGISSMRFTYGVGAAVPGLHDGSRRKALNDHMTLVVSGVRDHDAERFKQQWRPIAKRINEMRLEQYRAAQVRAQAAKAEAGAINSVVRDA